MKKIFYFLLIGLVPFLASCDKETVYTINKSGTITIKVVDSDGNGIDKAKIDLRLSGETLFYDSTDVSGVYKSEEILEGTYRCYVSAMRNGLSYNINRYVQVIAGQNKYIEINPFGESKKITVGLSNYYNDAPVIANVLVCPQINATLDEYKELAYFSGKTTADGLFSVDEVPYGDYYVVFYDDANKILKNNYMYVSKDGSSEFKFYIYASTITVKLLNYYNDAPIVTPYNVLITQGWMNSLEEYKQNAIGKNKTNDQGVVVFENIISSNNYCHYRVVIYDDNNNIVKEESVYVEESTPEFKLYLHNSENPFGDTVTAYIKLIRHQDNSQTVANVLIGPEAPINSLEEYKNVAFFAGRTTADGWISFDGVPLNWRGQIIFYTDSGEVYYRNYFYIDKSSTSFYYPYRWSVMTDLNSGYNY